MPKCEKGFLSLITLLLFLVLIGVFGWGVYYFRQQPISSELPRQLQQPTFVPQPTSFPIETYINPNLGFKFEYPKDWKVKEVIVQNSKILHSILEISPQGYTGLVVPFKLLSVDNPDKLTLSELDQKLFGKTDAMILYSIDDIYMLSGSGLAINFRNEGMCEKLKCQIYTFSRDIKTYQFISYLDAGVFEQRQVFDRIINSFKFDDFSSSEALSASTSARLQ